MDNFADRAERLSRLTKNLPVRKSFPLLKEIEIDVTLFEMLASIVYSYILASANACGLELKYGSGVGNLSNITPNGSFLPMKETALEFTLLHKYLGLIFKSLNLDQEVELIQSSSFLRFVEGKKNSEVDGKPYSTTKIHTDIWNGGPPKMISIFMPLYGDMIGSGIEFFEPDEALLKNYMRCLSDYNEGKEVAAKALSRKYDFIPMPEFLYLFDFALLHRTVKNEGGERWSIDFRFVPKEKVRSDGWGKEVALNDPWMARNFRDLFFWYGIGKEFLVMPQYDFSGGGNTKGVASDDAVDFISNLKIFSA